MGDTSDGSSGAAHRAHRDDNKNNKGLIERLFGSVSASAKQQLNGQQHEAQDYVLAPDGGFTNLRRMRVDDVAIPKVEIVSVSIDVDLDALVEVFRNSGLSRLPVFKGTLDTPIGLVHLKDLALKHGFSAKKQALKLREMVRPLLYAPPSMPVGVLLQKMQTDRIHMALVIDEYGGVDGLVTLEDLIETVIGEIEDEHDLEEDAFWAVEKPGVYLAQAKTPLDEFEAVSGFRLMPDDEEEIDTLGGLVFFLSGRVPARGEVIKHPEGIEFEIVEADPRRIKRMRVCFPGAEG